MKQSIIIFIIINVLSFTVSSNTNINKNLNEAVKSFNFPDYDSSSPIPLAGSLLRSGNNDHDDEDEYSYDEYYDEDHTDDYESNNKEYALTTISNSMLMKATTTLSPITSSSANTTSCHCVPIGTCKISMPLVLQLNLRIMTRPSPTTTSTVNQSIPHCLANTELCCDQSIGNSCGTRHPPINNNLTGITVGNAPYGSYPWQVVLLHSENDHDDYDYIGSGVLISASHVLTVAHKLILINDSSLTVRLGEWNMENDSEQYPVEDFLVLSHKIHPEFELANLKNDIAILKLKRNVTIGHVPTIGTICLGNVTFFGSKCWVSGWGRDSHNHGDHHHIHHHNDRIQKHVELKILENSTCQQQLSATRLGHSFKFDTKSFLCAGGESGKDACTGVGDGGAPLVCQNQLTNKWYLAGLVAWGIGCGELNVPGVYINIHNYIQWIQQNMN